MVLHLVEFLRLVIKSNFFCWISINRYTCKRKTLSIYVIQRQFINYILRAINLRILIWFFVLLQTKTVILEKQINIKLFYPNEIRDYTWTIVLSKHIVSKIGIKNIHNSKVTQKIFFEGSETDKVGISRLSHHLEDLKDEALRQRSLLKRAPFRKRNGISNCASNKTGRLGQCCAAWPLGWQAHCGQIWAWMNFPRISH